MICSLNLLATYLLELLTNRYFKAPTLSAFLFGFSDNYFLLSEALL